MFQSEQMMKIFVVIHWPSPRKAYYLSVFLCRGKKEKNNIVLDWKQ